MGGFRDATSPQHPRSPPRRPAGHPTGRGGAARARRRRGAPADRPLRPDGEQRDFGVVGDQLGYWGLFPAQDGWGRLPAWGFADVVAGDVPGVEIGSRVFGCLPMATHLIAQPAKAGPHGFRDATPHRSSVPAVYSTYQRMDTDPLHTAATEDVRAVFFPLFVTSFVLEDFLADNDDFGATQIIVTSASSKTAAGTALRLSRRDDQRPQIIGLTSSANLGFVTGLGCYDQVHSYADAGALSARTPAVLLDFAGNAAVRSTVHHQLGDQLRSSYSIGAAHWSAQPQEGSLPGPAPSFFFAPDQIEKRLAEWGPEGYQQRLATAWSELLGVVDSWVDMVQVRGLDALPSTYDRLLAGTSDPQDAYVVLVGTEQFRTTA